MALRRIDHAAEREPRYQRGWMLRDEEDLRDGSSPTSAAEGAGDEPVDGAGAPRARGAPPGGRRAAGRRGVAAAAESDGATVTGGRIGAQPARPQTIRKILVAIGGALSAKSGLPMLEMLARMFHAELILVSILPPQAAGPAGRISAQEAQATAYLEMVSARMHAQGSTCTASSSWRRR